ncbi:MAG TPA: YidC/Oxa1 family membrane protein insertase [Candidatus Saccharimonadales bacterium]|jgi:YidC/Oxa1 family membrane protein insertase|nr:YidC/Oxa1 family membrane protein insertase [Candidatus Saccharimonadales bacterium]
MFTTIIVQPIFNLLVLIYTLLPGHNFGLALIIFTIVIRLLLWPLVRKQLHQAKKMRQIQPELKRIKKAAAGNKQKESQMMMELYKERGINPFGSIGVMIIQLPILIGLYSGLRRVVDNPHQLVSFSYSGLQHTSWMQHLAHNIHAFDSSLFGIVDLTKPALGNSGVYWPAMIIVAGSAVIQYYQSKQLMPTDKNARGLRAILKDAGKGKQADQSEVSAAMGRVTRIFLPAMVFLFTVHLPSALSLYWLVGGLVAFIQQTIILREDTTEMEAEVDEKTSKNTKDVATIPEAEVVATTADKPVKKPAKKKASSTGSRKKRRK